jgi:hypothetical protein
MAADKTADAIKLNLRLPKSLHRRLQQRARRNNVSLNTEIVNELDGYKEPTTEESLNRGLMIAEAAKAALGDHTIDREIDDKYMVPLTEIGLWSPEYARIRHKGGHPPLPYETILALQSAAKRAKVTAEEYWKRKLRERGIDPDAPYQAPPSTDEPDQK